MSRAGRVISGFSEAGWHATPRFKAYRDDNAWRDQSNAQWVTATFDHTEYDNAGGWDATNYRYNIPCAGRWWFECAYYVSSGSDLFINIRHSTQGASATWNEYTDMEGSGTASVAFGGSVIYNLSKGDWVDSQVYRTTSISSDWYMGQTYSYLKGYWLGV